MSHETAYQRDDAKFNMIRERAFRTPDVTKDTQLARTLPIDIIEEGALPVLRPLLKRERRYTVGGGRTANLVSELGYDVVDDSFNAYLQTAKLLYAVMGGCVTTGTSYSPIKSDVILSGQGTAILTLTTGGLTIDAHIGDMLEVTSIGPLQGRKYAILDNTANTITIDINSPASINGYTVEIKTAPFTHTITKGSTIKSFASHYYLPNVDPTKTIAVDLLGILFKSLELTIEKNADAIQACGVQIPKAVDGNAALVNPDDILQELLMKWCHVDTFTLSYNALNPITKDICDSIKVLIENASGIEHVIGDCSAGFKKAGTVDYTITLHYFPQDKTLYNLRNTKLASYATDLNFTFKITYSVDRYIQFTFNKLYLDDHPEEIPSADDQIMGVDAVFKFWPGNYSPSIVAKDNLGIEHYEGSTEA